MTPFSGWAPWGAPGAPLGATVSFLTPKMEPKCSQKDAKGAKITPNGYQIEKKWLNMVQDSRKRPNKKKYGFFKSGVATF